MLFANNEWSVREGKPVPVQGDGKTRMGSTKNENHDFEPETWAEWASRLKERKPHWFDTGSGTGASPSPSTPASRGGVIHIERGKSPTAEQRAEASKTGARFSYDGG